SGAILEQDKNRLVLKVNSSENVIKFRYFPFLESSSCLLEKEAFAPELPLIKLTGCEPGSTVEVKSKPVWQRVWESLK
ncbi:MAG: hypothetical protein DCC75_09230, partial [Proteobacteria bacterium]